MKRPLLLVFALALAVSPAASAKTAAKKTPPAPTQKGKAAVEATGGAAQGTKPTAAKSAGATEAVPAAPDTKNYLADTTVLARVENRVIRVWNFRDRFFNSGARFRPASDSAGRVEFLNSMINKDVMGLTAFEINRPLTFEDRVDLRGYTRTVLQNVLYQRVVVDSIVVTPEEVREVYPQFGYEQRLRGIRVEDRATAERLRANLRAGRIRWKDAVARYSLDKKGGAEGDLGWFRRFTVKGDFALKVFAIGPTMISEVVQDADGFHLYQCVERRTVELPNFEAVRRSIAKDLHSAKQGPGVDKIFQAARARAGVAYDTTNIRWAVSKFKEAFEAMGAADGTDIDLSTVDPHFEPADTGRVLARTPSRRFTLDQFMTGYRAIPPLQRGRLIGFESFVFTLDGMFLEPQIVELAHSRGIEKDSLAIALIEGHREELLVEHLYQDSILSRVSLTSADRKRYYKEHETEFVSIARVRYARIVRPSKEAADSLIAALRAGAKAESVVTADSGRGVTAAIEELRQDDGSEYSKILFEELRPGQATRVGPDGNGNYLILHLLNFEAARTLTYDEAKATVDDALRNIEAERLLKAFLARHQRRFRIRAHPELVMRIRLTPTET